VFLGIDIGTSAVKVVAVSHDTGVMARSNVPLSVARPQPLWSEQSPDDWWGATCEAVSAIPKKIRDQIEGVGLSGQMHGAVLLDEHDDPLRPAILWNNGRSHQECLEFERREPQSRALSGNLAMPGFTAPKLLWVKTHEPDLFEKTRRVLLPKDFIRLKLTGEHVAEMSDASGTLWLNTRERKWSDKLLSASGLDRSHMPRLVEGSEIAAQISKSVASELGIPIVPVVGGGGDNAAGAVGVGVNSPGQAFLSLGTSGVIFLAGDSCLPSPETGLHAFCHALPGKWHQMSVMLSAASCLDWAAGLTRANSVADFVQSAEQRGRLDGEEIFLPYLSGERTPHNDPKARGVFFGMGHDTDAAALSQSVLEGVAFGFADGFQTLVDAGGHFDSISVIGGGSRSAYWGRILSAALNKPLSFREDSDLGPAFGAARLAMIGAGGLSETEVCVAPPEISCVEPDSDDVEQLAQKRRHFQNIYQSLKQQFQEASV